MSETTNTTEQKNDLTARLLYQAIATASNPEPVYIIDHDELWNLTKDFYTDYLSSVYEALKSKSGASIFKTEFNENTAPVILLTKPGNKKAGFVYDFLSNAGITVFLQDATKPFSVIHETDKEKVKAEIQRQYRQTQSAGGNISEFEKFIKANANTPAIKTGFNLLDKELDGGLYEGLHAIGAISSLGKTTFCLNIAEQIASKGHDVLIIALEMGKFSLMARSISRLTFVKYQNHPDEIPYENCKTSRGISDGSRYKNYSDAEKKLIQDACNFYAEKIGPHIFIHEAIGNLTAATIRDIVKRHKANTGAAPVVIVDYLQLVKTDDDRINANDKTRTDYTLTELKQLTRDYNIPIIAISSFNRAGYNTEVKMENFKESGGIDYGCDVIIGLQMAGAGRTDFDVNEAKAKNPREIELVFLKNREAPTGEIIKYRYYPKFNHFEETADDVKAEREYQKEQAQAAKEKAKANRAEAAKIERAQMVEDAFNACQVNGAALINDMVDFCGGKPKAATLEKYIIETGKYKITFNRIERL